MSGESSAKPLCLVAGAAGALGRAAVAAALREGFRVQAVDFPEADLTAAEALGAETQSVDLLELPAVLAIGAGARLWIQACDTRADGDSPLRLLDVNVTTTEMLCRAAVRHGKARFVLISAACSAGPSRHPPSDETAEARPASRYAAGKRVAEQVVLRYQRREQLPVTVVRAGELYGPACTTGVARLAALCAAHRELHGSPQAVAALKRGPLLHFAHVEDVASAALLFAAKAEAAGRTVIVADATPLTWGDVFGWFAAALHLPLKYPAWLPPLCAAAPQRGYETMRGLAGWADPGLDAAWDRRCEAGELVAALRPAIDFELLARLHGDYWHDTRAAQALGFTPRFARTFDGFAQTLEWYRAHRWLPAAA